MNAHDSNIPGLPINIEAEQLLLGTILQHNEAYDIVSRILEPQHFYEPIHREIFKRAGELIVKGRKADPITIKSFLPDAMIGEMTMFEYLLAVVRERLPLAGVRDYAIVVQEAWAGRQALSEMQAAADSILNSEPGSDVFSMLADIGNRISTLQALCVSNDRRIGPGKQYMDAMTAAKQRGKANGVPICLKEIEQVISEPVLEAGNLYGLLSSSGEGKTSLTMQIIDHALERGHPALFLSYDQSVEQCVMQMIAQRKGIEARRQRLTDLSDKEWDDVTRFSTWLDGSGFEIEKCVDHTAAQLAGIAKSFVKRRYKGKTPLIVVDHIGSVAIEGKDPGEGARAKMINKIFKAAAETTNSAWLILNQRNTYGLRRDNPRPIAVDVFGGDAAVQAYDAMIYLYRQEKFKEERIAIAAKTEDWNKINMVFGEDVAGVAEIGAVKVRFGPRNIRKTVRFEETFTRYVSENPSELIHGGETLI